MKILIISDTHLGEHFEEKKFNLLRKIIAGVDKVIINGDFWEGYTTSFDTFIKSPWKRLFPYLLKRKAIYLYDNHDKKEYVNDKVKLFSVQQAKAYSFRSGNKKFFVEHGDRIAPLWDKYFHPTPSFIINFLGFIEKNMTRNFNKKLLFVFYKGAREKIKMYTRKNFKKNEFFVCGHIPLQEIDISNHYINSGLSKYGLCQYIIIENGKILAKEAWHE